MRPARTEIDKKIKKKEEEDKKINNLNIHVIKNKYFTEIKKKLDKYISKLKEKQIKGYSNLGSCNNNDKNWFPICNKFLI